MHMLVSTSGGVSELVNGGVLLWRGGLHGLGGGSRIVSRGVSLVRAGFSLAGGVLPM